MSGKEFCYSVFALLHLDQLNADAGFSLIAE